VVVYADNAEDIAITGPGRIDGNGMAYVSEVGPYIYKCVSLRPFTVVLKDCRHVLLRDFSLTNSAFWTLRLLGCDDATIDSVRIDGDLRMPNNDGIDIDRSSNVRVHGCHITTGDDCISLKSGRGEEANTINRPCEDVRISNCTFSDRFFACIGIGSETSAGVKDVVVEHCKCVSARTQAIYIKSRPGRGAYVENISVNDFEASGAKQGFLRLNNLNSGKVDEFSVPGDAGIPEFRNFKFSNIRVTDEAMLVQATEIHPRKPLVGFSLTNVTGTCKSGITLANMRDVVIRNVKVTGFDGPLISVDNVTGMGLAGAAKIDPAKMPKVPEAVAEPEKKYELH